MCLIVVSCRGRSFMQSHCMKLRSLGWDVLDHYKHALANHGAHIHSHWSGEGVGRVAMPTYMDVLDWPQVLVEAVRNACILPSNLTQSFGRQITVQLTKSPLKIHSLTLRDN